MDARCRSERPEGGGCAHRYEPPETTGGAGAGAGAGAAAGASGGGERLEPEDEPTSALDSGGSGLVTLPVTAAEPVLPSDPLGAELLADERPGFACATTPARAAAAPRLTMTIALRVRASTRRSLSRRVVAEP